VLAHLPRATLLPSPQKTLLRRSIRRCRGPRGRPGVRTSPRRDHHAVCVRRRLQQHKFAPPSPLARKIDEGLYGTVLSRANQFLRSNRKNAISEGWRVKPHIVDLMLIAPRSLDRPCAPQPKRKWLISVLRRKYDVPKDWIDTHWLQVYCNSRLPLLNIAPSVDKPSVVFPKEAPSVNLPARILRSPPEFGSDIFAQGRPCFRFVFGHHGIGA